MVNQNLKILRDNLKNLIFKKIKKINPNDLESLLRTVVS